MTIYSDVGAYDAKTNFSELLRKARSGMAFHITNRGEHVADLVPPGTELTMVLKPLRECNLYRISLLFRVLILRR